MPSRSIKTPERWVTDVTLQPPSLQNNTADADRLCRHLKERLDGSDVTIDMDLLPMLPQELRQWRYRAKCLFFETSPGAFRVTGLSDPEKPSPFLGLAVDLGTSRVVLEIVDLHTGERIGGSAFDNPQIQVGPDVLTRMHAADTADGLSYLTRLIQEGLQEEATALSRKLGLSTDRICLAAVSGNTAMTHLFLGLTPRWMIREPYIPVVNRPGVLRADRLGLGSLAKGARVFVFPSIGSYFGGDLVSGILFSGLHRGEEPAILVDVGTNAEVVLGDKNWLVACAGAAGPALEGGVTRMGMMAGPGVIDSVRIDPETRTIHVHTIEEAPPRGICGSGVIDLAAQLFLSGMVDIRGKLVPEACGAAFLYRQELAHLVVVPAEKSGTGEDLCVSQADLDSLVRSKAAMYTILETITAFVGMTLSDLSTFFVAGTFGSFIDPVSAITIGMIPDLPLERYRSLGNSSLEGALRLLRDPAAMPEVYRIQDRITYMELNVNQEFMNRFSAAKFVPHTHPELFPSVGVPGQI